MDEEHNSFDSVVDAFINSEPKEVEPTPDPEDELNETPEVEEQEEETTEEVDEGDDEGDDESDGEGEGDEEGDDDNPDTDEPEVEVVVGDQTHKVKVAELKRLYGQEAALTQRSQAVANQNRILESQGLYLAKLYEDRLANARKNHEKYKNVDLWQASRELEPEEFDALRSAKEAAEAELRVLDEESANFMQNVMRSRAEYLREQAKSAIVEIRKAIPEWDDGLYRRVSAYAVSQGMDPRTVNEVVDPGAIIMMHKAMLYDDAKSKSQAVTKKVVKAPKKVASKADKKTDTGSASKKLIARARMSGDVDDVAEAFMAAHRS